MEYKAEITIMYGGLEKNLTVYFTPILAINHTSGKCSFCGKKDKSLDVDDVTADEIICNYKTETAQSLKIAVEKNLRKTLNVYARKSCHNQNCTRRHHEEYEKIIADFWA